MPAAVSELARAKVNLELAVVGRRADGYHLLDSIVAFADVADRLSFEEAPRFELVLTGPFAGQAPLGDDNLIAMAAQALFRAHRRPLLPVRVTLEKNIPLASGLGGGSADAAAALRGLIAFSALDCSADLLHAIAAGIGADVPVCLRSHACQMSGVGDIVAPIAGFRPRHAVLVNPGAQVSTAAVFQEYHRTAREMVGDRCRNHLTAAAMKLAPVIAEVLDELERQAGLEFACMSGSGATCFGLFPSADQAAAASRSIEAGHPGWWCRATRLS